MMAGMTEPTPSQAFESVSRLHSKLAELYHRHADSGGDPAQQARLRDEIAVVEQEAITARGELTPFFDNNVPTPQEPAPEPDPNLPDNPAEPGEPGEPLPNPTDNEPPKWTGAFYVNPNSEAAKRAAQATGERKTQLSKLAERTVGVWWNGGSVDHVRTALREGYRLNQDVVLVAYNAPGRDNGGFSKGGAADLAKFKQEFDAFAEVIRQEWIEALDPDAIKPTVRVIIEPDAVNLPDSLDATRKAVLKYAAEKIDALHAKGQVEGYIDTGHSNWRPAEEVAKRIISIGIPASTNLVSNVSSFQPTDNEHVYLAEIARLTGGRRWIIDTARNGLGQRQSEWCNPWNVLAGVAPTLNTGRDDCDAYIWIKPPGESDGNCNGGPDAGQWFDDWAIDFARRSIAAGKL